MVQIIGEVGINANGDLDLAKQLIDMAKECGVDLIKFQKRDIETVYSKKVLDSQRNSPWGTTTREQKMGLEFGREDYDIIDIYCKDKGIPWFASAWDVKSLEFLDKYDLPHHKIASAMITHHDFLKEVASRKKHTFISTGMATMMIIEQAVDIFARMGTPYTLMHSVSAYPCPDEECNIGMIPKLLERFSGPVGYSGHEEGLLPSILAVAFGASVIERHITLSRSMYGSDQSASLEKHGLEILVRDCRLVKTYIGNGRKAIGNIEQEVARKLRYWRE